MARTSKVPSNLLIPSPKELDKALTLSADRALMAEAIGLKMHGIAPETEKTGSDAAVTRRATKA